MKIVLDDGRILTFVGLLGSDERPKIFAYPEEGGPLVSFTPQEVDFLPLASDQMPEIDTSNKEVIAKVQAPVHKHKK